MILIHIHDVATTQKSTSMFFLVLAQFPKKQIAQLENIHIWGKAAIRWHRWVDGARPQEVLKA